MEAAPSQPSLSWIAATPRAFAIRIPSRVAATHSSSRDGDEAVAEAPGGLLAQDPGRLTVGPTLDDAAGLVQVARPPGRGRRC